MSATPVFATEFVKNPTCKIPQSQACEPWTHTQDPPPAVGCAFIYIYIYLYIYIYIRTYIHTPFLLLVFLVLVLLVAQRVLTQCNL